VIFRYLHVQQSGTPTRAFFGVSMLALAIMWVIYMVEILTAPWV
jgi:hypothetical protein